MNELTTIDVRPLDAYRMSTDAAGVCRDIVVATASTIQGRKFVSVEGWQAIALAHGCVAGSRDVERIEGGVRAIGEVRRMSDGGLIATAEGFVGEDEPTWFGGKMKGRDLPKRNDYAIRAMAQTRAISRACRSAFAHVVVMMKANLETTPAAEVPSEGFDHTPPHDPQTGEIIEGEARRDPTIPGITKIRNNLNKLRRDGGKATDLEAFNALVHACKDDLQKIKDAEHSLWTGMGEDFDGFKAWIKARREELAGSLEYQMLCSCVNECKSGAELQAFLAKHGDAIGSLDGEESRKFETLYDARAEALKAPTPLDAGLVGG